MKDLRKPTKEELRLLRKLVDLSNLFTDKDWEKNLLVKPMADDGMGGLYLYNNSNYMHKRVFGKEVSSIEFHDIDGILIVASLYLDNSEGLLELDIFKTDFTMMKEIPFAL